MICEVTTWICEANIANNFDIYIYPIAASILAAFIFWIVFSHIPQCKLKSAFNRTIRLDLLELRGEINEILFACFEVRHKSYPLFHAEILGNRLSRENIRLFLRSKTLCTSFPAHKYPIILRSIEFDFKKSKVEIDSIISRLYSLSIFIAPTVINTIRLAHAETSQILYIAEKEANSEYVVDPTAISLAPALEKLMGISFKLSEIIANQYSDSSDYIELIWHQIRKNDKKMTTKMILRHIKKFKDDKNLLGHMSLRLAINYAEDGKQGLSIKHMKTFIDSQPNLARFRDLLTDALKFEYLENLINNSFDEHSISIYVDSVKANEKDKKQFIEICNNNLESLKKIFSKT